MKKIKQEYEKRVNSKNENNFQVHFLKEKSKDQNRNLIDAYEREKTLLREIKNLRNENNALKSKTITKRETMGDDDDS